MSAEQTSPDWVATFRKHAESIFLAGVRAADPETGVKQALKSAQANIFSANRVHVISIGKAACTMARTALDTVPMNSLVGPALVVTNYENAEKLPNCEVYPAGHPLPDENGLVAAKVIQSRLHTTLPEDLVLVLMSGGGSALTPYPPDGISLKDKISATEQLLASGADIYEFNTVRKHLSLLKGGGLMKQAAPAHVLSLILSDVIGDDLSVIASGPTVPDASTFSDAINILCEKNIWACMPKTVHDYLNHGRKGEIAETPKPNDALFAKVTNVLVGGNGLSLAATADKARANKFETSIYSENVCGEAREEAEALVKYTRDFFKKHNRHSVAIVAGGETTVTLKGDGKGGRNQEFALAFAIEAEKHQLPKRWIFLSAGTDGRDGPTDAAGAIVDPWSLERMRKAGQDPVAHLQNNNAYQALEESDDLLKTGATGTNVADLQVLLCF